jgi:hypothetical protein
MSQERTSDELLRQLRKSGKFVFAYDLRSIDGLPVDRQRAQLKINFEKSLDAFFQSQPPVAKYSNEPERM